MGEGASPIPGKRKNRPWTLSSEPGADLSTGEPHDELRWLLIKNTMWMIVGLGVIISGLVIVAWIANSGRISSDTGNDLTETGFVTQRRNSCVGDLRNESDFYRGEVLTSVLNRLAVLDGVDPRTGKPLPRVINEAGETIIDADLQGELAAEYVQEGLRASRAAKVASEKLLQPTLTALCGRPVTNENNVPD